MSESVLIIGGNSSIGMELAPFLRDAGFKVSSTVRPDRVIDFKGALPLDLRSVPNDLSYLGAHSIVIILAGLTSIKACENNPDESRRLNVVAPSKLGEHFISKGAFCIFTSTSLVCKQSTNSPVESDPVEPHTVYGVHKEEAERFFLAKGKSALVMRTTKVISKMFPLFIDWVESLKSGKTIQPYLDNFFSPISTQYLLPIFATAIKNKISGIFHLSASNNISYADAAMKITDLLNFPKTLVDPVCEPRQSGAETRASMRSMLGSERLSELGIESFPDPYEAINWWVNCYKASHGRKI